MIAALVTILGLCSCGGSESSSPQQLVNVDSVCDLAIGGTALDGRLVKFRSGFEVAVEHVRANDSACPQAMVFLRADDSSVDLTLCSEANSRFGCPVNPDFEVKATFAGTFHASKGGGFVDVTSMTDIRSESTQN
jgi:hypothetical protein